MKHITSVLEVKEKSPKKGIYIQVALVIMTAVITILVSSLFSLIDFEKNTLWLMLILSLLALFLLLLWLENLSGVRIMPHSLSHQRLVGIYRGSFEHLKTSLTGFSKKNGYQSLKIIDEKDTYKISAEKLAKFIFVSSTLEINCKLKEDGIYVTVGILGFGKKQKHKEMLSKLKTLLERNSQSSEFNII